jgi:programmed cell death protein 5
VGRISLVKPEKARAIEDMLIRAGQTGQLAERVSEPKLISMLEQMGDKKKETKVSVSIEVK